MSKSRGNIVRATPIHKVLGTDALRYFLLREVVFGQDGSFSYDALVGRYNSDLANGLGNLASRTLTMIHQYRGGAVPSSDGDSHIAEAAREVTASALDAFDRLEFSKALEAIWGLIAAVDKFIVERAPWKLAKSTDADSKKLLDDTLYTAAETLRIVTALMYAGDPGFGGEDLGAARLHANRFPGFAPKICTGVDWRPASCSAQSALCSRAPTRSFPSRKCANWKWRSTRASRPCLAKR